MSHVYVMVVEAPMHLSRIYRVHGGGCWPNVLGMYV